MNTHVTTSEHDSRNKHRRNILRPDFESLGSILSISNFIFIFWCIFVTQTVSSAWLTQNLPPTNNTVLVTKRHENCKILHQQNYILKVCIKSFQNPVLECLYDLWLWFYANFYICQNGQKKRVGVKKTSQFQNFEIFSKLF